MQINLVASLCSLVRTGGINRAEVRNNGRRGVCFFGNLFLRK